MHKKKRALTNKTTLTKKIQEQEMPHCLFYLWNLLVSWMSLLSLMRFRIRKSMLWVAVSLTHALSHTGDGIFCNRYEFTWLARAYSWENPILSYFSAISPLNLQGVDDEPLRGLISCLFETTLGIRRNSSSSSEYRILKPFSSSPCFFLKVWSLESNHGLVITAGETTFEFFCIRFIWNAL